MNRAQTLAAIRNRVPDSIAPDGTPLMFIPARKLRHPVNGCCRADFKPAGTPTRAMVSGGGATLSRPTSGVAADRRSHNVISSGAQALDNASGNLTDPDSFALHERPISRNGKQDHG